MNAFPFALIGLVALLHATPLHAAEPLRKREWVVDGVTREALIYLPERAKTEPVPVVFAFHGHGGSMRQAANSFQLHTHWPEPIVIYPQGLKTPGQLTDPGGRRTGWQAHAGDQGDRDLKFFDVALASLKHDYRVDVRRLYATGHSNGGGFTYLLWAERGDQFAAFAPSGAADFPSIPKFKPRPVMHIAGEKDPLVKFAWQQTMITAIRKVNQCADGQPWEGCTLYPSKLGAPVVTFIHPGTHQYPSDAPSRIVKFFKQHALTP